MKDCPTAPCDGFGNTIDGTQAEFVRIPSADTSLYPIPDGADEEALAMLSDILPTGFDGGVLNGKVIGNGCARHPFVQMQARKIGVALVQLLKQCIGARF